jgi:hypothetical protein
MDANSNSYHVQFKLSVSERELLEVEARARKLSKGLTAKHVLLEALSGFDQKQEFVLRRMDAMDDKLTLLRNIGLVGAAAAALPFDAELVEQQDAAVLREKLRTHFVHSSALGKSLLKMIEDGKL